MGLPCPGPRKTTGTAAFATLTRLGSARLPCLLAAETPDHPMTGHRRSPWKQGPGGWHMAPQHHGAAGSPAHTLTVQRRNTLRGVYVRQWGTEESHMLRAYHTHQEESGQPSRGRLEPASEQTSASHPRPDLRGCLL